MLQQQAGVEEGLVAARLAPIAKRQGSSRAQAFQRHWSKVGRSRREVRSEGQDSQHALELRAGKRELTRPTLEPQDPGVREEELE